jgi:hypothetical protein
VNTLNVLRFDRDRELTGDIVPEAYFRCAAVRELSFPWAARSFERQFTEIRAGWTDKFLYVHLWAKDSWIVGREAKPKGRVYEDDCLEVYLMPEPARYWGWEVNPLGTLLDYRVEGWGSGVVEEKHFDYRWKSSAQGKVRRHDAGWVFELKVPFQKDLGVVPRRGDTWRATFNRLDLDRQGRQTLSTFSDLSGEGPIWFHQPDGFGQIVFG